MITENLQKLYQQYTGVPAEEIIEMPASGSNRRYFRLTGVQSLIGVYGTSVEENEAFLYMAEHFKRKNLPVPKVHCVSEDKLFYLQEDLGDTLLFHAIEKGRITNSFSEEEKELLRKTIRLLPSIQFAGAEGFDFNHCYPQPEFNQRSILWDLNYFKYCFLKATGLDFQEDRLENEFERLAYILLRSEYSAFMYRDFQSRNVMIVKNDEGELVPYFIDFQGGRKGPVYYDVASFLWQAKANFHPDLREELVAEYIDELQKYMPVDVEAFYDTLKHFVLFRTMQVLGAYGFRGYFEKKPHFLQSIPFAIDNLRHLLKHASEDYPYLIEVLQSMTEMKQFKEVGMRKPLVVRVLSFSYKKGIPADPSGNGGGFVFDCRAIHNPGRYEPYKKLTGMDKPVIAFLEKESNIAAFLENAYSMVDEMVDTYIKRGFKHVQVCCGCTGGQHRSVYSAEHIARHVAEKFGVRVVVTHKMQGVKYVIEAK